MFYAGMQINPVISFKSRNSLIKDADYLRRAVNRHFPVVAYSKAAHEAWPEFLLIKKFKEFILSKNKILLDYRQDRRYVKSPFTWYKNILYCISKEKIGACAEQSELIELALRINGIQNCGKASLVDSAGNFLNHSVAFIKTDNNSKKTIIIDPWLQDCGYIEEMLCKYRNEYAKYFKRPACGTGLKLVARPPKKLTPEQMEYFREKYPGLVIQKKLF